MMIPDLAILFARELASLRDELLAYPDERDIWALPQGLPNSAGTLVLHLSGNLRWFIGAHCGGSGYVRERDAEFSRRGVPREELIREIEAAADEVARALASLDPSRLEAAYPLEVGRVRVPTGRFLVHLASHLAYHLGQVDYHRRIVTGSSKPVGAVSVAPIAL